MKNKLIALLLSICLLFGCVPETAYAAIAFGSVEEEIWYTLRTLGYSEAATAGIMGNAMGESSMRPGVGDSNIQRGVGAYGLFQFEIAGWQPSYQGYKYKKWLIDNGYDFDTDWKNASLQLEYLFGSGKAFEQELKSKANGTQYTNGHGNLVGWPVRLSLEDFKRMDDPREAADFFLMVYERPAKPTTNGRRADYATNYFAKYHGMLTFHAEIESVKYAKNTITLSWNEHSAAKTYVVYECLPNGSYKKVKTTSALTYTDSKVKKSGTYKFYIKAYDQNKKELYTSSKKSIYVCPGAKTTVSASQNGLKLKWKGSDSASVAAYRVLQRSQTTEWKVVAELENTASNMTYEAMNLKTGIKYSFKVVALDSERCVKGFYSAVKSKTYVQAVKGWKDPVNPEKGSILCSWERIPEISGYQIQYSSSPTFKSAKTVNLKGTTVSYKKSGLPLQKTYYFRIRSKRVVGKKTFYSAWSEGKSCKVKQ